jgi:hypothetical protein
MSAANGNRFRAAAATNISTFDWNLDIWRCEAWHEPLGSVFDLDRIPDQREPCHAA